MVTRKVCSRRNKKTRRHNKKSRKHIKHTLKGGFSLSDAAPVNQETVGEYTAGPNFLATSANYAEPPTLFSDSYGKVRKHGCAGTKSKVSAAKGNYKNMFGGKKLMAICPEGDVLTSHITGPKSGHAMFHSYTDKSYLRDLALPASYKGGKQKNTAANVRPPISVKLILIQKNAVVLVEQHVQLVRLVAIFAVLMYLLHSAIHLALAHLSQQKIVHSLIRHYIKHTITA